MTSASESPDPPAALPVVTDRNTAHEAGFTDRQITRRLRNGAWLRLHRGYFAPQQELTETSRWRAEVLAAARASSRPLILGYSHAARAWGLPEPLAGWGPLTFVATRGARRNGDVRVRVSPVGDGELAMIGVLPITSAARTVADCARTLDPWDGLAIADAALRRQALTLQELAVAVERQRGWPGAARARLIVNLADGRRESPFESWSAWSFCENGVPAPVWQMAICDAAGAFLGRADAWWWQGVAGEADGRAKYRLTALERGGAHADGLARALHEERLREIAFRRTGLVVVRWDPRDVLAPYRAGEFARHLCGLLAGVEPGTFTGRAVRD